MVKAYPHVATPVDSLGCEDFALGVSPHHRPRRRIRCAWVEPTVDLEFISKRHPVFKFKPTIEQDSDTFLSPIDRADLLQQ